MVCDTQPVRQNQTLQQRKEEVREVVARLAEGLASGRVTAKVGPQGAIAFLGINEAERSSVTDACIYRRVMASGSVTAKIAIMRAEQLAGRSVDKTVLAGGAHSHDGGTSWHGGHK